MTYRLKQPSQIHDWLFFASIIFLVVGTTLLFLVIGILLHIKGWILPTGPITPDLNANARRDFGYKTWSYLVVIWTSIFAIKFSFLWFFRLLVDRLRSFVIYWRVVVVVSILAYIFCAFNNFIICRKSSPMDSK